MCLPAYLERSEVHGLLERAILLTGGGDFDLHLRGEGVAQVVLDGRVVHIVVDNETLRRPPSALYFP